MNAYVFLKKLKSDKVRTNSVLYLTDICSSWFSRCLMTVELYVDNLQYFFAHPISNNNLFLSMNLTDLQGYITK